MTNVKDFWNKGADYPVWADAETTISKLVD
jgi:hypothetical protein